MCVRVRIDTLYGGGRVGDIVRIETSLAIHLARRSVADCSSAPDSGRDR